MVEKRKLAASTVASSKPQSNRAETVATLDALLEGVRPSPCDVYGPGPLLVSDVPKACASRSGGGGVIMGIDEAGRGPVLGPMTYAAAYWSRDDAESIPSGFNDSKALTPEKRSSLFEKIKGTEQIGFVLRVLHASEIARNMLRSDPYNLNAMSHDAAMQMVRAVLDAGVKIDTCYVDTVGVAESYRAKLEREFEGHGIKFVVEKKADAKYAPCSAASVVAKVSRDLMTETWKFSENNYEPEGGSDFGSGYPSDPKCVSWLEKTLVNPVFCFPDFVRFSWTPAKNAMEEKGVAVQWEADDDEDEVGDGKGQQMSMNCFVVGGKDEDSKKEQTPKRKKPRLEYLEKMGLSSVAEFVKT